MELPMSTKRHREVSRTFFVASSRPRSVLLSTLLATTVIPLLLCGVQGRALAQTTGGNGGRTDSSSTGGVGGGYGVTGTNGPGSSTTTFDGAGGGGGGVGAAGGAGGNGGYTAGSQPGGAGGAAGAPGVAGGAGGTSGNDNTWGGGGGGGGGGGTASTAGGSTTVSSSLTGGAGGQGGSPAQGGGGGGGAGGYGLFVGGAGTITVDSGVSVTAGAGGNGGNGGQYGQGGGGGDGGIGIYFASGGTLVNNGSISGGAGGAGGATGFFNYGVGAAGRNGAGVSGAGLTVINSGSIAGGGSGDAIDFTGGVNTLAIAPTSSITGKVVAFSTADTFVLGGTGSGTFDVSQLGTTGSSAQYQGFGLMQKTGNSTWTLTGTPGQATPWTIVSGTLSISSDANLGTNNETLTFDDTSAPPGSSSAILQSSANISMNRAIVLNGSGGTLAPDGGTTLTLNDIVSGTGALTQGGTGTVVLTGANTYNGATTIDAGATLQLGNGGTSGSIDNTSGISDNGEFIVDRSDALTIAAPISGGGKLDKNGAGKVLLTGDSSGFTGTTTVNEGILSVNGTLGGVVNVMSGGTLGGTNGTVGSTSILAGGNLAPGNSIGTLNVSGNLTFAAGSTYTVEVDAAGASDRTNVTGTATLGGASVSVLAANGNWNPVTKYTIVTAAGGVNGSFGGIASNLAFLIPTLSYDPNDVFLQLVRNDISLASVADTRNQRATATALDALGSGPVYGAILPLDAAMARSAFDQLSGEIYASERTALIEDSHFIRDAINDRLRQALAGSGDLLTTASIGSVNASGGARTSVDGAAWGRAFGGWQRIDGDGNAAELSNNTGGIVAGLDGEVFSDWRLGFLAGYSHTDMDVNERRSSAESDNYHLGVYGGRQWGALSLRSGLAYSWNEISTSRNVSFTGFNDHLSSDDHAGTLQAFGELGYSLEAGGIAFEPFADLAYVHLNGGGFSEAGGAGALSVVNGSTDTTFTTLGARAAKAFMLGEALTTATGTLGWRHAYSDTVPTSANAFAGGDTFTVAGVPIAKDAALIEAGLETQLSPKASVGLYYNGQFGDGATANGVNARLAVRF
jgi:outer membrane autotransporter protein